MTSRMRSTPKLLKVPSPARPPAGSSLEPWAGSRGIGALAIPGVGPFIAAGPIVAALSGVAIGAAIGGIAGGLIGLGIPEIEAKRYEGKIKEGNILISVHTDNSEEITRAKAIFTQVGAQDICTTGESATPKQSKPTDRSARQTEAAFSPAHR